MSEKKTKITITLDEGYHDDSGNVPTVVVLKAIENVMVMRETLKPINPGRLAHVAVNFRLGVIVGSARRSEVVQDPNNWTFRYLCKFEKFEEEGTWEADSGCISYKSEEGDLRRQIQNILLRFGDELSAMERQLARFQEDIERRRERLDKKMKSF